MRSLLLLLVLAACRSAVYDADLDDGDVVTFVKPIKGNDLVVDKGGKQARVRLVGVYTFDPNAHERKEIARWARSAAELVQSRAAGKSLSIALIREELDPRGRHLGFASLDGVDLGRLMIEEGVAAAYTEYPFAREADYLAVEGAAREAKRGLWGSAAAAKRVWSQRDTWSTVRRDSQPPLVDPLLAGAPR